MCDEHHTWEGVRETVAWYYYNMTATQYIVKKNDTTGRYDVLDRASRKVEMSVGSHTEAVAWRDFYNANAGR